MPRLRSHLPFLITGVVAGTMVAAGPTLARAAYDAVNADKVDGKHAVSAAAPPTKRANKLVATNRNGRLPNNIIERAPDADRLGGKAPSDFADAGHDHDARYYTRSQMATMASQRLVAVGLVHGSTGNVVPSFSSGPVTGVRDGTGLYSLTVPGLRPGCTGGQPLLMGTPSFAGVFVTTNHVTCNAGSITFKVALYLWRDGSFYDADFNFAIYAPPPG